MTLSIDALKKLQQKKYRSEYGYFIAEGEHLVLELIAACRKNPKLKASELFVSDKYQSFVSDLVTHSLTSRQMEQVCATKTPQGIFALVPISAITNPQLSGEQVPVRQAMYFYEIQDPGNLGTILRTIAWFGNSACLLSPDSVDVFNPKVVRASMGAIFHVPLELDIPLSSLTARFSNIAYMDMQGDALTSPAFRAMDCYVFGNEARGVPVLDLKTLGAKPFSIAGSGSIESLNLAATVSMCEYELNRER
jgi:TrmH family RNA methyltransferase